MNSIKAEITNVGSYEPDPIFLNSRREAVIIFLVWLAALIWAVPYCYFNGYYQPGEFDPASLKMIWGIPSWIFWGIAAPWLVADIATICFCFYMANDELAEVPEGTEYADEAQTAKGENT